MLSTSRLLATCHIYVQKTGNVCLTLEERREKGRRETAVWISWRQCCIRKSQIISIGLLSCMLGISRIGKILKFRNFMIITHDVLYLCGKDRKCLLDPWGKKTKGEERDSGLDKFLAVLHQLISDFGYSIWIGRYVWKLDCGNAHILISQMQW